MNTPTVSQMKGLVDTEHGLLDRQIFFSQEIYQQELSSLRIWAKIRYCCAGVLTAGSGLS